LVNFVINRLDAIRAGDVGRDAGKIGSCRQGGNGGEVERADYILDVGKSLSDTVCASAADEGSKIELA